MGAVWRVHAALQSDDHQERDQVSQIPGAVQAQICRSVLLPPAYACHVPKPWTRGTTKAWHAEEGWGVITSPDVAEDVWVHFSNILGEGYRELASGEPVEFRYEERHQDGFRYAAVSVRRPGGHA